MAHNVRYSAEALTDLEEVTDYAELHFPATFERFFTGLLDQIEWLALYPRIGSLHDSQKQVRKIQYPPFVIYYRITEPHERIDILHIWHGTRRPPTP